MMYTNGDTVSYAYDPFDRTMAETYNDGTANHYIYASDGRLVRQYIRPNIGQNGKFSQAEYMILAVVDILEMILPDTRLKAGSQWEDTLIPQQVCIAFTNRGVL